MLEKGDASEDKTFLDTKRGVIGKDFSRKDSSNKKKGWWRKPKGDLG